MMEFIQQWRNKKFKKSALALEMFVHLEIISKISPLFKVWLYKMNEYDINEIWNDTNEKKCETQKQQQKINKQIWKQIKANDINHIMWL